jgi:UDP-glucose 4-epimerase
MHHLIIGGAGFIGSNLANQLIKSGEKVMVLDDLSVGEERFLKYREAGLVLHVGDVNLDTTWEVVRETLGSSEIFVWHLAANSDIQKGASSTRPDFQNTLTSTISILNHLVEFSVKGIVFASSSAVYGEMSQYPSELSGLNPISYYGASKLASENFLQINCNYRNTPLWIFRFANVVGTPATHGVVYDFCRKLNQEKIKLNVLGNGAQTKAYIHVNDLLSAISLTIRKRSQGGIWNLGPLDHGISVREIAESACQHLAPSAKIEYGDGNIGWPGDIAHIVLNSTKIAHDLDILIPSSKDAVERAIHEVCDQLDLEYQCDKQL